MINIVADFKYIFIWWLTYFLLGLISLPLVFKLFSSFWDRGYIFAKTITSIVLTNIIFVLGVFKFVPFTNPSLFIILLLGIVANGYYLNSGNNWSSFQNTIKSNWKSFLIFEFLFFILLTTWSYVRGFAPDIEGLEKFMDWGFVNSALRSQFMPPADMWFSGLPINYYYFGHLVIAVITRLSGISSNITYNLAIASTMALTFTSAFSLTSNFIFNYYPKTLRKSLIFGGLLSAILLTFGGNLHTVYKLIKINIQNEGHLVLTPAAFQKASRSYWYPDATRFIGFDPDVNDKTIHEFPLYSFVVADLHGHMNNIPNVILILAFIFSIFIIYPKFKFPHWYLILPLGWLLSIAFMTNAWDLAVYGLVFGIFMFIHQISHTDFKSAFYSTLTNGLLTIVAWYLFTIPFSLNFIPMAEGLKVTDMRTPFYQLFVLYGGFWLITFPFLFWLIPKLKKPKKLLTSDLFVFSLIITATILIIIPEIGYIKDIYIFEHRRANTMFKLVYQAFMMYSLCAGYVLYRLRQYRWYKVIFGAVLVSHMIYPYFAIKAYYGLVKYRGLYGLEFLQNANPTNLEAIDWINQNIKGQPVMLEAVGDSYTLFNQVSMATGLPTVQGWVVHEWLWRGGYDQPAARQTDVQNIYEATTPEAARQLLQKYNVQYVFVGDKEREKYTALNENIFSEIGGRIIFESGQTKIYQLY